MSAIRVYHDSDASKPILDSHDRIEISHALNEAGVRFEQWQTDASIAPGDSQEKVIATPIAPISTG
jgi:1,2-dihydroxy-3-keto-5-methylthiopentene dioxygenase